MQHQGPQALYQRDDRRNLLNIVIVKRDVLQIGLPLDANQLDWSGRRLLVVGLGVLPIKMLKSQKEGDRKLVDLVVGCREVVQLLKHMGRFLLLRVGSLILYSQLTLVLIDLRQDHEQVVVQDYLLEVWQVLKHILGKELDLVPAQIQDLQLLICFELGNWDFNELVELQGELEDVSID